MGWGEQLLLNDNELTVLPPEIRRFKDLEELQLRNNRLFSIPPDIRFTALTSPSHCLHTQARVTASTHKPESLPQHTSPSHCLHTQARVTGLVPESNLFRVLTHSLPAHSLVPHAGTGALPPPRGGRRAPRGMGVGGGISSAYDRRVRGCVTNLHLSRCFPWTAISFSRGWRS